MRLALALMLLRAQAALAAGGLGHVTGAVADPSGAALVDVALAAIHEETGIRRTARTDAVGRYLVAGLEPGMYKITARKPGFQTVAHLNVQVGEDKPVRLDFMMPVGSIREVLTVESAPAESHPADSAATFQAGRRWIDTLPLDGRGILTILDLAPGVIATPASSGEAGQFSVNGQRANKNSFSVDGVSVNSGVTGSAAPAQFSGGALPAMTAFGSLQNLAALDSLYEARVETSAFAPDSGRTPGAQVRLSTRSGSNEWHGSTAYALRHERLAANDWFAASRALGRAPFRLNQWAASLGGPVRRDRTFFFASWEGLRLRSPFAWVGATPSDDSRLAAPPALRPVLDAFPRPTGRLLGGGLAEYLARGSSPSRLDSGSVRIDHALSSRVAIFGRYSEAPSTTEFGYTRLEEASFRSRSLTIGADASLGGAFTAESRLRIARNSVEARWIGDDRDTFAALGPARPAEGVSVIHGLSIGGVGQLLSGATDGNSQGQLQFVAAIGSMRGPHAWRAGVEYQRLTPARARAAAAVAGAWPDLATFLSGSGMRVLSTQADQASSLIETLSSYVQDTWHPIQRLTLTFGLRWEITPAPSLRQTRISPPMPSGAVVQSPAVPPTVTAWTAPTYAGPLWPTRYGQIAPRVGAAYRVGERSVVRAGWGVFYDLGFSVATDPINGFPFNRWQFGDAYVAIGPGSTPQAGGPAPGLRLPYSRQWNLSWEQGIGMSDTFALSYTGSAGRHLLRREAGVQADGAAGPSVATNNGRSDFHSLGVQYRRRLARGVEAIGNYRWARSMDNGSWDSAVALVTPEYTAGRDRGRSSFDTRHSFSAAVAYESRGLGSAGWWRRITADWKAQAILRGRSGFPIDVLENENALGLGWDNYRRPDLVANTPLWIADGSAPGGRRLNPDAFRAPGGMQGTLGRNAISGFGMFQADAALRRRFPLAKAASLEVGLACFNVANHPIPADPVRYRNSVFFGQSVSLLNLMLGNGSPRSGLTPAFQLGSPRSVEIAVKLRF